MRAWMPIARGVKNCGNYRWTAPPTATQAFVRLLVSDRAGNVCQCETANAVVLDQSQPRAHITRVELSVAHATAWLDRIQVAVEAGEPGPVPVWASNTLRTLASLYVFADRGVRWYDPDTGDLGTTMVLPHREAVQDRIARILALTWRGLG